MPQDLPGELTPEEVQFLRQHIADSKNGSYPTTLKRWVVSNPVKAHSSLAFLRDLTIAGEVPSRFSMLCLFSDILMQDKHPSFGPLRCYIYSVLPAMMQAAALSENCSHLLQLLYVWQKQLSDIPQGFLKGLAARLVRTNNALLHEPLLSYFLQNEAELLAAAVGWTIQDKTHQLTSEATNMSVNGAPNYQTLGPSPANGTSIMLPQAATSSASACMSPRSSNFQPSLMAAPHMPTPNVSALRQPFTIPYNATPAELLPRQHAQHPSPQVPNALWDVPTSITSCVPLQSSHPPVAQNGVVDGVLCPTPREQSSASVSNHPQSNGQSSCASSCSLSGPNCAKSQESPMKDAKIEDGAKGSSKEPSSMPVADEGGGTTKVDVACLPTNSPKPFKDENAKVPVQTCCTVANILHGSWDERAGWDPAKAAISTSHLFPTPPAWHRGQQHPFSDASTLSVTQFRASWRKHWEAVLEACPGEMPLGSRVAVKLGRDGAAFKGTIGAFNAREDKHLIHYDTGETLWFDPDDPYHIIDRLGVPLGSRVAVTWETADGPQDFGGTIVGHNANCCYLVDYHNGLGPILLDPTRTPFRVMEDLPTEPIHSPHILLDTIPAVFPASPVDSGSVCGAQDSRALSVEGSQSSANSCEQSAIDSNQSRTRKREPVAPLKRSKRYKTWEILDEFHSETDEETILTETCPKCQVRLRRDTIGPHFRRCIPKWGKKEAGGIHANSRVEVKFFDDSEAGFTWYSGTITGKTGAKYTIIFDEDDGYPWEIDAKTSCYRLLDDGIKLWAARVGRLVPGTRLEVEFDDLHESTWELATVVGVNSDGTYTVTYDGNDHPMILDLHEGYARIVEFAHAAMQPGPRTFFRRGRKRQVVQNMSSLTSLGPEWPIASRHHLYSFLWWDPHIFTWEEVRAFRKPIPVKGVEIRRILKAEHPARGGLGLFAAQDTPAKRLICVYTGLITVCCEDAQSQYITKLGTGSVVDVDASTTGNEARFINDYRDIALRQNVSMKSEAHELTGEAAPVCFTERQVAKGEEFLLDYGQQYWDSLREELRQVSDVPDAEDAYEPVMWPEELEYTSGFRLDTCVTLPQLRVTHSFRRMRGVRVIKQADGRPALVAEEDLPKGHLVGVYSGRVGKQMANERSLPIGNGCYIVECGNEAKYLRHATDYGNVYAEGRNDNLIGHLYLALLALETIPVGTELVLNRSLPIQHTGLDNLGRYR